jgi:hypothetical protein
MKQTYSFHSHPAGKQWIGCIFMAAVLTGILSCTDLEEEIPATRADANTVNVLLGFRITAELSVDGKEIPQTYAPDDVDEDAVKNVWIFQFDDNDRLVGTPYYIETVVAGVNNVAPLINSEGITHRLVYVANVNNKNFPWSIATGDLRSKLLDRFATLSNETETYGDIHKNLIMSGEITTEIGGSVTQIGGLTLTRSVAKVQVTIKFATAIQGRFKAISVQLRNVSDRLDWFDALKGFTNTEIYPAAPSTIDYPLIESDTLPGGTFSKNLNGNTGVTFEWYVPRNARGTINNTTQTSKNALAPQGATYFEVMTIDLSSNRCVAFRIYPGADRTSDFNILPNHQYITTLTIKSEAEAVSDSRVEDLGTKTFVGLSNSYILNPMALIGDREFQVPITQVNRYWTDTSDGYGNFSENISLTDGWTVALLWQDAADIVRAINPAGQKYITISKATGIGPNDYFTIHVPAGAKHGNFVVALKKGNPGAGEILWSWHFWVTDYNPDSKDVTIKNNTFAYDVTGGQVHHYGSRLFGYTRNPYESGKIQAYTYSENVTYTTPYAKSVMMDRNIGTITYGTNPDSGRGSLHYQFGRKDPFPGNIPLYDIAGTALTGSSDPAWVPVNANAVAVTTVDKAEVPSSVKNPLVFYTDWINSGGSTTYVWGDTKLNYNIATADDLTKKTNRFGKSIYDPCPEGWKVALDGTWEDFPESGTIYGNPPRTTTILANDGIYYWPNVAATPATRVYYPTTAFRYKEDGTIGPVGSYGNSWSASPSTDTGGFSLFFSTNKMEADSRQSRGAGFSVRCVSE